MRVGVVTNSIDRNPTASVAIYTKNLVENLLTKANEEVDFVLIHTQESDHAIYKIGNALRLPYYRKGEVSSSLLSKGLCFAREQLIEFSPRLCKLWRKHLSDAAIDVLHIPDVGRPAPAFPFGFLNERLKLIVTNHGMANLVLPSKECYGKSVSLGRFIDYKEYLKWRAVFRQKCDALITVSESEKRILCEKLSIPAHKIHVIYHGVSSLFRRLDAEEVKEKLSIKYGINFPFILHLGGAYKKNALRIIEALSLLKLKGYKLIIGGRQPEFVKQSVYKWGVENKVVFTGFIAREDLPYFYSGAAVFVFPSLHESFGFPIIEAMACGTPVITSNIYSMPEVAGDAAVLVNPYDVDEIAEAISELLSNQQKRESLIQKGLERAKQFTWEKSAREHLEVYKRVVQT